MSGVETGAPAYALEAMTEPSNVAGWQRPLLPGELLEAPGGKRSARDWVVDVVLFVAAMVIGVLSLNEATRTTATSESSSTSS